ncbi:MAG: hypothetical protein JWQ54_3814 [Mucilaginibacter sp.]|nr:hypothetical protein [Mucilaginibacter sp.]
MAEFRFFTKHPKNDQVKGFGIRPKTLKMDGDLSREHWQA